jgi:hypothetical protein
MRSLSLIKANSNCSPGTHARRHVFQWIVVHTPDPPPLTPRTDECVRNDKNTCFKPDSPYFQITHRGLDAMVERYMDLSEAFCHLPPELALANHTT